MSTEFCPECHQPLSETIAGVRLPRFKARLFRFIESHPGQSSRELSLYFYGHASGDIAIRAHIFQINDALMNTAVRIRGDRFAGYSIERPHRCEHRPRENAAQRVIRI